MNLNDLNEYNQTISGTGLSLADRANRMAKSLYDQSDGSIDKFSAIVPLFSCWINHDPKMNNDDAIELARMLNDQPDKTINLTTEDMEWITLKISTDLSLRFSSFRVLQNNEVILTFKGTPDNPIELLVSNVVFPDVYASGHNVEATPQEFVTQLSNGVSITTVFADLSDAVSNNSDIDKASLVTICNSVLTDKLPNVPTIKQTLLNAASMGPEALLNTITSILNTSVKRFQDIRDGDEPTLNDTSFEVAAFSWGIVGGTVLTIANLAGSILTMMGGVITVLGVIISTAATLIKNFVSNMTQAQFDAIFLNQNPLGCPCFDIVVDSYDTQSDTLNEALDAANTNYFTLTSRSYPCIITGYREPNSTVIHMQELPSVNFSFAKPIYWNASTKSFEISNAYIRIMMARRDHSPDFPNLTIPNVLYSASWTLNKVRTLHSQCYSPVSLSMSNYFDTMKDFTIASVKLLNANVYCERLLTAIILWLLYKNWRLINAIKMAKNNPNIQYVFFPAGEVAYDQRPGINYSCLEGKQYEMLGKMSHYYASGIGCRDDTTPNAIDFSAIQDNLISTCKQFFNNIAWRSVTGTEYDDFYYGLSTELSGGNQTVEILNNYSTTLPNILSPQDYSSDVLSTVTTNWSSVTVSSFMSEKLSNDAAIKVPRTLKIGVFFGVLVDVLIIAAVATITAIAFRVRAKYRAKMRRAEVDLEAKKYQYENSLSDGSTPERQDQLWKEYKKSRTKFNIQAMFSGGAKTIDLYTNDSTSDSSSPSIISRLTGDNNLSDSNNNILSIARLIKGS